MNTLQMELKQLLKQNQTAPILFVGAGITRRYLDLPNWEGLLRVMASLAREDEFAYEFYQNKARREGFRVDLYQKVAELIENDLSDRWYELDKFQESRTLYKEEIIKGVSPLKIEIAKYIAEHTGEMNTSYEHELKLFKRLGEKSISGVITTNYDTFLEQNLKDYSTYVGQDELIFSNLQGVGEIYKIHGCCTVPKSIVIDEEDYLNFEEKNAYLAAKILTLFLEHPIIFLGYSIGDRNIQSILHAIVKCLEPEKLEHFKKRLIFIEWNGVNEEDSIATHSINFGDEKILEMTKVKLKDFSVLYEAMLQNHFTYKTSVLRRVKEQLYELVLTNDPKEKMRVVGINDHDRLEDIEVVVGVGILSQFGQKGYLGLTAAEIIEDVLFDNREFDAHMVVAQSLPTLLSHHANSIPIYKYVSKVNVPLPEKVEKEIKQSFDEFLSRTIREKKERGDYEGVSFYDLIKDYPSMKAFQLIPLLPQENIPTDELGDFLRKFYKENSNFLEQGKQGEKSDFRRLVKIYDWLKYHK